MASIKGTKEVRDAAQRIADRSRQMLNDDPSLSTLIAMLNATSKALTEFELAVKPVQDLFTEIKKVTEARLIDEGLKGSKVEGVGTVTLATRKAYKLTDREAFCKWLEAQRASGATPLDIYGWFGSTLDQERVSTMLSDSGVLPDGVGVITTQTFRFTPSRSVEAEGEANE